MGQSLSSEDTLSEEGAYGKSNKENRYYCVVKYTCKADRLDIDIGDQGAFQKIIERERFGNIDRLGNKYWLVYDVPPGWFTKYLTKTGPDAIYTNKGGGGSERVKGK